MQVPLGDTYYFKFTTRSFSTGAPTTLSGTPVISVYEEGNLTQITAGITLTADYDSVTGLNDVAIVATSGNGYEAGKYYNAVITTGTVGGVSVVGETVGHFRIMAAENVAGVPASDNTHVSGTAQTAGDIPALVTTVDTVVDGIQTDLSNGTDGLGAIKADTAAAATAAALATAQNDLDIITGATGVIIDGTEAADLVDEIWDEVLTGGTHNVANSAGRRLRSIQEFQGYENGAVWLDTVNGTAGTTSYENGTVENPVDTIANATTIATNVGLKAFHIINGSSVTLAQTYNNYDFVGQEWTLALGGQDIGGSFFRNVTQGVSGTATGTTPFFEECSIGAATLPPCAFDRCGFTSTLTLGSAGNYYLIDCFSQIAGASSPTIDMGAAVGASNLSVRRWSGGITLNNLASGDVVSLDGTFGTITLNGADAQVEIRGIAKAVVNNLTGSPTVNDNSVKETQLDTISSGIIEGSAATGTLSTTQATTDLTGYADDQLIGRTIIWTSGNCDGEGTDITDYASASGLLTFTALTTAPGNGDTFKIV